MHEWIRTALAAINTTVLVAGAGVAYYEFIGKSATSETARIEETLKRVQGISENSGYLLGYLFDKSPAPDGLFSGTEEFGEATDRALGAYFNIALCVDSGECDPKTVARLVCPFLLTDAFVINRTLGAEIAAGGAFIDRPRIWSFYEQVESCRKNPDLPRIDHASFLARFQNEIDMLSEADRAMFDELKASGWQPEAATPDEEP